jgi:hypothetical protein
MNNVGPKMPARQSRHGFTSILEVVVLILVLSPLSRASYTLTVTANHGSVTATPSKPQYEEGETVELTPRPDTGYCFTGWSGDTSGRGLVLTLRMDGNKTVTANFGTWTPPLGIPMPSFGIFESYRMYDTVANRSPGLTYHESPSGGYYTHYIDNTSVTSTDTGNACGTVDQPRKTIPNPLPEGSVVEVHGGPYSGSGSIFIKGYGTVSHPIFVRATAGDVPYFSTKIRAEGTYLILEEIGAVKCSVLGEYNGTRNTHHLCVRYCDIYSASQGAGGVSVGEYNQSSTVRVDDVIFYNNKIHDFGDVQSLTDQDYGCAVVTDLAANVWLVDNDMCESSGSGVQIIPTNSTVPATADHIYIGRNHIHRTRQSGVWAKYGCNLIFSQNTIHDVLHTSWSPSKGMGLQYGPQNAWYLFNDVYRCVYGWRAASTDAGADVHAYVIGNLIHDSSIPPAGVGEQLNADDSQRGSVANWGCSYAYIIGNTLFNVHSGVSSSSNSAHHIISNNIIANLTLAGARHVFIDTGSSAGVSVLETNLFYQNANPVVVEWGSVSTGNMDAFRSQTSTGTGCIVADPQFIASTDPYLSATSPAIDAGTSSGGVQEAFDTFQQVYGIDIRKDIEGRARSGAWDIGAYEYVAGTNALVLNPIGDRQIVMGTPLTFTLSASGGSGTLVYSASGLPAGANFSGQTFTWTPSTAQVGSYQVTFTVSDGKTQDAQTITITVTAQANSVPVLAPIGNKSVNENQLLTFGIGATDADSDPITYSATGLPSGASLSGRTFNWTPAYSQAGSYNVTFTASDGQAQDSETIIITVANVNRPPVLTSIGSLSVNVGSALDFTLSATDPDGDSLSYSVGTLPSGAALTGSSFTWTPAAGQDGSYSVTFTVSDGTLTDAETATITVVNPSNDQIAPVVAQCSPAPEAIQVPLDNLVTLHVADGGSGVDANTVILRVNGSIVHQGNVSTYSSASGQCSRSGAKKDYQFLYQPKTAFDFDQVVAVRVNAADLAGNVMSEYAYSFTTQMRVFGRNVPVSTLGSSAASQAVTACDPAGSLWVAWADGTVGSRDIYVAQWSLGARGFSKPLRLTTDSRDQCCPALCIDDSGTVYVAWQDNRSGNWDIYLSLCRPGASFSQETKVTTSTHNETNPALAVDHQSPGGVSLAWQDDRNGNWDIYVAGSTNGFTSSTLWRVTTHTADQTEPTVAVDASNSAYVFWTDLRNGQADLYGAASSSPAGAWTNVPVATGPSAQTQPAVAAGADGTLHLVWADNRSGNNDIYYAALVGLPSSPVAGIDLVDDTSGAEQTAPAVAWGANQKVFACWTDSRHLSATDQDTDLYLVEVRAGTPGTNVFVGDDGTNANQSEPALGVDHYGQPYVVWTDSRRQATEIYYAGTTQVSPTAVDSRRVTASAGATLGTDPAALSTAQDVSLVIPPGACRTDLQITISRLINPQVAEEVLLGSYEFSPSGITFEQPVTVTIAYATGGNGSRALPYWYDSVTGALSQRGITEVRNLYLSSQLSALQFRTTHFTPFYVVVADSSGAGGGSGGGCAVAPGQTGSPAELVAPYAAIALIMLILRRRDRRNRMRLQNTQR